MSNEEVSEKKEAEHMHIRPQSDKIFKEISEQK